MRWSGSQLGSGGLLLASSGKALDGTENLVMGALQDVQFSVGE